MSETTQGLCSEKQARELLQTIKLFDASPQPINDTTFSDHRMNDHGYR
jgi:hypothetical protein